MRAVVIRPGSDLRLEEREIPAIRPGFSRVRVLYGGICGSDLHYVSHGAAGTSVLTHPMILGHEVVGVIDQTDAGGALVKGTAVAVHPATPCGSCMECARGDHRLCPTVRYLGSAASDPHTEGAFADVVSIRNDQLRVLPPGVALKHAALIEPLSVAVHAVNRAGDVAGRRVVVNGAGPIGQLVIAVLAARGAASITAVDLANHSLATAQAVGASELCQPSRGDALPQDADIVFEATGSPQAWKQAVLATRRGGILVQVGLLPSGELALPVGLLVAREVDYRGSYRFDDEIDEAITLLAAGLDVDPVISHVIPVTELESAFAVAADRSIAAKVLLDFTV